MMWHGRIPARPWAVARAGSAVRHVTVIHRIALVALAIALSLAAVLGLAAASPGEAHERCTHGLSSIGPVIVEHGKVVGGDTTPHTEACLP